MLQRMLCSRECYAPENAMLRRMLYHRECYAPECYAPECYAMENAILAWDGETELNVYMSSRYIKAL